MSDKILIGSTGFVGKNLCEQEKFDYLFNSKNIESYDKHDFNKFDLYLSCLPATKWMINNSLQSKLDDLKTVEKIFNHISSNKYSNVVLISTIDVYCNAPKGSDEDFKISIDGVGYGENRALFEKMVVENIQYDNLKIVRLPAIFGPHLKKNIIFDIVNNNNTDQINLNSYFQWYNIQNLYSDIKKIIGLKDIYFNLFSEPISTQRIVELSNKKNIGISGPVVGYDYHTKHNSERYIMNAEETLLQIEEYFNDHRS